MAFDIRDDSDSNPEDPKTLAFWVQESNRLREAANLCWETDGNIRASASQARLLGLDSKLTAEADLADSELNWLYGSLMAFAIQHLGVGLLIHRDPMRFMHEAPGYRIVEILDEAGIALNSRQHEILSDIENAFKWSERGDWNIKLNSEEVHRFLVNGRPGTDFSESQRRALESLYAEVKRKAEQLLAQEHGA
jgi:hypothetical protein